MKDGPHCHRPLIEIDYYGEWLVGPLGRAERRHAADAITGG
jgi:hypothetical protein